MPSAFIASLPIFLSGIRTQPLGIMEISKKNPKEYGIGRKTLLYKIKFRKMPLESTYSQTALSKELEAIKNQMNLIELYPFTLT